MTHIFNSTDYRLSLLISQKREPPKLIGLNDNLEFRLCSKTEFIPFDFYSKGHKSDKKDCLICWKKMWRPLLQLLNIILKA